MEGGLECIENFLGSRAAKTLPRYFGYSPSPVVWAFILGACVVEVFSKRTRGRTIYNLWNVNRRGKSLMNELHVARQQLQRYHIREMSLNLSYISGFVGE